MARSKWAIFAETIEKSVEKHGADKPLTLGHLHNILKLVDNIKYNESKPHDYSKYPEETEIEY